MIKRSTNLLALLDKSSYFLLGPRGVGKSYLIRHTFKPEDFIYIDLLDSRNFLRLQHSPAQLEAMATRSPVVIDEVQRLPELLNEVHRIIEEKQIVFLLTGSSARKLRKLGVNLLAGRALKAELFPFTWFELKNAQEFSLEKYLLRGGVPKAYLNDNIGAEYLYSYVDTYLKQEIQAEALVRNLANYARFLETTATNSGAVINFTKIANDAQLSPNTVRDYYQILEDTLLGFSLHCWHKSIKRKAVSAHKFYFFDIGVVHTLTNTTVLTPGTDIYGRAFEHFIAGELRAYIAYSQKRCSLNYWRSTQQHEVDFVVGDEVIIEVKASTKVSERDHRGLKALKEEHPWKRMILVSLDAQALKFPSGIEHLFWQDFLEQLWAGDVV